MDTEQAIAAIGDANEALRAKHGLKSVNFIEPTIDQNGLKQGAHRLKFAFQRRPSQEVARVISENFAAALNRMDTGNKYIVVDMTRSVEGLDFTKYAIQKVNPIHSDLNTTHYSVNINSNPSLGESVDIYMEGLKNEKDDLINALRAYKAIFDFHQE